VATTESPRNEPADAPRVTAWCAEATAGILLLYGAASSLDSAGFLGVLLALAGVAVLARR
jgi:hypothetical protein